MWHGRGESAGRTRFLDDDERKRLMAGRRLTTTLIFYPAVLLAITTGMRKGEILSLRWPQSTSSAPGATVDTKNGEARTVPVPKIAADLLTERGKVRSLTDDRLFTDPRDFDRCWRETLAAAEIADFRFHDLRVILLRPISPRTARRWPSWPKSRAQDAADGEAL